MKYMNFGTTLKNIGNAVGKKIESVAHERELRLNNPTFQLELMNSRNEFAKHISNAGSEALNGVYQSIIRAPAITVWYGMRSTIEDKQTFGIAVSRGLGEFGEGVAHLGNAVVHTLKSGGRLGLHTLRWVFAK
jgi:hypothetical protein